MPKNKLGQNPLSGGIFTNTENPINNIRNEDSTSRQMSFQKSQQTQIKIQNQNS